MLRSTWSTLSRGITRGQHVQRTVRNMNLNAITRFLHTTPVVDRENESDAFVPLSPEDVARFHRDGYLVVKNALDDAQVDAIEAVYDEFMSQQRSVPGRDYGDHSQGHGVKKEDMVMINVNQPTLHHPDWRNNVFERFCRHVVKQLYPELPMVKDYDQLLTKLPNKPRAQFPVHQDMAYWPKVCTPIMYASCVQSV